MSDLREQVRMGFAIEAAERADALDAIGFPSSPLWLALEAPVCFGCGMTVPHVDKRGKCDACVASAPVDTFSGNAYRGF